MSLILEYLHKHGVDQVEIFASGGGDSGGVESVEFIAKEQADLPSDIKTELEDHLTQWTDDYLYDRLGAWYNDAGGRGTLTFWWDENGGEGELDFVEYLDSNGNAMLSDENKQTLMARFNRYLNQHPEVAKWTKAEKIGFLEINIECYSDNLDSPDSISVKAHANDEENSLREPDGEILRVLQEYATTELVSQVADIIENAAYEHMDAIDSASSYLAFDLNGAGFAETMEADLSYGYRLGQDCGAYLDEQELLEIDDRLSPSLRARMEKDLLGASVQQPDSARTKKAKQKKASMLGL